MSKYKWKKALKYCEPTTDFRIFQSDWINLKGVMEPVKYFYATLDEDFEVTTYRHMIISPYNSVDEHARKAQEEEGLKEMIRICDYFEENGQWEGGMEEAPKTNYKYGEEIKANRFA